MDTQTIIHSLDFLGGTFIAVAALGVHHRVLHEHKIDEKVVRIMKWEQKFGVIGVLFLFVSFILKLTTL